MDRRHFLGVAGFSALAFVTRGSLDRRPPDAAAPGPSAPPRLAMVVDPARCGNLEGCTRCIAACHRAHNVPAVADPRHEVKWIWKETFERAFTPDRRALVADSLKSARYPVLCNHCDNPPCVRVCPTSATWKRDDGVVMMDWHRCIGCRYCMAACPYGSRSFNWEDPRPHIGRATTGYPARTIGVVEKCTFCEERLARGQSPLCVEACPERALVFGNLADERSEVRGLLRARHSMCRKPDLGTGPSVYYLI